MDMDSLNRRLAKFSFNGKARSRTYRKIASFLKNGVSLPDTLRTLHRQQTDDGRKPKDPVALVFKEWLDKIANGQSFGRAVTGWVPPADRIVIEAGEAAGSLAGALENALFIQESSKKIRSVIIGGVMYPIFLVLLAIMLLIIFGVRIVPAFASVLPREKWTGVAAQMATVADFVNYGLLPTIIASLSIIGVIMWSMPRWTGSWRVKADKMVPWSLYRLNTGAGFMLSMSALVKAGVQIPEILRILMRGSSPWYFERLNMTLGYVNNGINIGESLYLTRMHFPDEATVQDLRAYASFDNFDETLELLGRQWVVENVDKVQAQMAVLRNLSLVVLGIVFGTIATGIFALQQQVTQGL
jgi:type II secretory pathway component PulF